MQWKTRSKPAVWMFIFMLVMQLFAPLSVQAADDTAEGLILTFDVSKAVVPSGEEFSFKINYSASSTVSSFADPNIKFALPEGVTFTGKTDSNITTSTVVDSVDFPGRKEILFAFKDGVLPAGSTGQLVVKGKFENYVTPAGTSVTAKASYHATVDGTPVMLESNEVTVTSTADANWTIEKNKIRPLPEPFKGSDVEYEIVFREPASATTGMLNIRDVVVTDKLPAGAVFVSADNGGTPGPDNTVVWHLPDDLRGTKRLKVVVHYPNSMPDTEVTNLAEAAYTPLGQSPVTVTAQVVHGFEATPKDDGTGIVKWTDLNQKEVSPGQTVKFHIGGLENKANIALDSAIIEDMTPTQTVDGTPIDFALQSVKTAPFSGISDYDLYYTLTETPSASDWVHWQQVSASGSVTLDATALGSVKGVQVRFGTLPINYLQANTFVLTYKVPDDFPVPVAAAETVKNTVTYDFQFNGDTISKTSFATVDIVGNRPLLNLNKSSSKLSLNPLQTTTYTIQLKNEASTSSNVLDNPIITDLLPVGLDYQSGTWQITKPAGMTNDPTFTALPQADGTTQLTWTWDDANPGSLGIGETLTLTYDAKVQAGTQEQTLLNKVKVLSPKYLNDTKFSNKLKKCVGCPPVELYSIDHSVGVTVNEDVALQSEMWVKGELDSDWSKYPGTGTTAPGGRAQYQLKILNVGNVATSKLSIVNTFARIGDTAVMNGSVGRGSQWGPLLTGPVVVPSYVQAFYSTTPGITMNAMTGADSGVWLSEPPQDLTAVTAVKFVFDEDYVIDPLDSTTLEWPMVAPVGAPTGGEVAWNSYGYKMFKTSGESILPAEPLKIGITIQESTKAEIGNYVWQDQNENGIQEAAEPGINGVRAELYREDGTKLGETLTGDDFTGNPGYYLFPNLDPGNYYVVFRPSAAQQVTAKGQGADSAQDSDADPATGRTELFTLANGEKNHSVDAGLIPKKGALGNYVWLDTNGNGVQDAGEAGVNGVTVELYNGAGLLLSTTTTAANNGQDGYYAFEALNPGTYQVKVIPPSAAYSFTAKNQGTDSGLDSDINPGTGETDAITLTQSEENETVDVGLVPLPVGSIGDYVWLDKNRNGLQDPTEKGLNQVKVQLFNEHNALIAETLTADRAGVPGYYLFDDLTAGTYSIKFITPYTFTNKQSGAQTDKDSDANAQGQTDLLTLLPGQHIDTIDAGVYSSTSSPSGHPETVEGSLGDLVWNDANRNGLQDAGEAGLNGVTVELYNDQNELLRSVVTADQDGQAGHYRFTELDAGKYQVRFLLPASTSFTAARTGGSADQDSNADPATGRSAVIVLGLGENNLTVDAGLVQNDTPTTPDPSENDGNPGNEGDQGNSGNQENPAVPTDPAPAEHPDMPGQPEDNLDTNLSNQSDTHQAHASAVQPEVDRSNGQRLLPQTGEQAPVLPYIGWGLCLLAGSLLLFRKYAK